jgi:hypothetical protein
MKNPFRYILFLLAVLSLKCCIQLPDVSVFPVERIRVGAGPEDMVLDTLQGDPRLIISCSARRETDKPYGEIISFNLRTGIQSELKRFNEPTDLLFRPHGIYLDGDILYVISHEEEPDYHPILIYHLHGDSLEFQELIHTALQYSPNALVTGPGGAIYFVNDSGKRGSIAEKAFRLKRANVVRITQQANGDWHSEYMAMNLGYPAGINRIGNRLFVGDAILNRIHVFNLSGKGLTPVMEFKGLRGNDNLRISNGQIVTPGHVKPLKFIKHARSPKNLSPVAVYRVDPVTGESSTLYYTDGSHISGGSTALMYEGCLYICQVFEPFILKVHLSE